MGEDKKPAVKKPRKTAAQKRAEAEAAEAAKANQPDEPTTEPAEPDPSQSGDQTNPDEGDEQPQPDSDGGEQSNSDEGDEQPESGESGQQAEGLSEYTPKQRPLKAAGLDQHAAAAAQEKERQAERDEHNLRTAGRKWG